MINRRSLFGFLAVAPVAFPAAVAATCNNSIVDAMLSAITQTMRKVDWRTARPAGVFKWEIAANGDIKGWTEIHH